MICLLVINNNKNVVKYCGFWAAKHFPQGIFVSTLGTHYQHLTVSFNSEFYRVGMIILLRRLEFYNKHNNNPSSY